MTLFFSVCISFLNVVPNVSFGMVLHHLQSVQERAEACVMCTSFTAVSHVICTKTNEYT